MRELYAGNLSLPVESFCTKVWKDEPPGPKSTHTDFAQHLPEMVSFRPMVLFSNGTYSGNPFYTHQPLQLGKAHFDQLLMLFREKVYEYFEGGNGMVILQRAETNRLIFRYMQETANQPD